MWGSEGMSCGQMSEFPGGKTSEFPTLGPSVRYSSSHSLPNAFVIHKQVRDVHIQTDCLADGFVRLFGQMRDVSRKRIESTFRNPRAIK